TGGIQFSIIQFWRMEGRIFLLFSKPDSFNKYSGQAQFHYNSQKRKPKLQLPGAIEINCEEVLNRSYLTEYAGAGGNGYAEVLCCAGRATQKLPDTILLTLHFVIRIHMLTHIHAPRHRGFAGSGAAGYG